MAVAGTMGTGEQVMAWFMGTYFARHGHAVSEILTGKPVAVGGTEGRREATGRGVAFLAHRACEVIGLGTEGASAVIQGFGNEGSVSAYLLARRYGIRATEVSGHTAAYYGSACLSLDAIERHVAEHGGLAGLSHDVSIDPHERLLQLCDLLAPAAVEMSKHSYARHRMSGLPLSMDESNLQWCFPKTAWTQYCAEQS